MIPKPRSKKVSASRRYGVAGVVALLFLGGAYAIYAVVNSDSAPRKRVMETIALKVIPPPPPPPPPPTPPPPPKVVEEQKIQQPVDKPDDKPKQDTPPPQAADLGASQGPCTIACVATTGRDPGYAAPTIGGNGNGRVSYAHYASLVQEQIRTQLRRESQIDFSKFRGTIRVWLTDLGKVDRVELRGSTGDDQLDTRIKRVIADMPAMPEMPAKDMPQPVFLRFTATPGFG